MNPRVQIIAIAGSVLVFFVVLRLIQRRKLREEYALFWLAASVVLIALSLWRRSLDVIAAFVGVAYSPSVLILGVIGVGFLLAMHYSISLSRLADQNKRLAQEVALLRQRLENGDPGTASTGAGR
jgi:hypothetical protein